MLRQKTAAMCHFMRHRVHQHLYHTSGQTWKCCFFWTACSCLSFHYEDRPSSKQAFELLKAELAPEPSVVASSSTDVARCLRDQLPFRMFETVGEQRTTKLLSFERLCWLCAWQVAKRASREVKLTLTA